MGIVLVEKVTETILREKFKTFNINTSVILPDILPTKIYGQETITELVKYFSGNIINVKSGYPTERVAAPTIYVCPADDTLYSDIINHAERNFIADDVVASSEGKIYTKSARVICASDNYTVATILYAICKYFLHQEEDTFSSFDMVDVKVEAREFDFISKFLPENMYYRNFIVTFTVADTIIVSKDDTIKGVTVIMTTF